MTEFERIDEFLAAFKSAGGRTDDDVVTLGPGDDCAFLALEGGCWVTTDQVVEGVHFRRDWSTPRQIGHKALAVNLSDLAAMGAEPRAFTCAMALPKDYPDAELVEVARGLGALANRHGCVLAGGNFTRGRDVSLTITAFGAPTGYESMRRAAAQPGDLVLLVGEIGVAGAELGWLVEGRALPPGKSPQLEPEPLCVEGRAAAGYAHAGIDVSDGLVQDLGHVARASRVGIRLDARRLPRSDRFNALVSGYDEPARLHLLLGGGEDYALALTVPPERLERLQRLVGGTVIGAVEAGRGVQVDHLPPGVDLAGHDHFR